MDLPVTIEERRTAIEVIATLVNIKREMGARILKPAGVPVSIYVPLLKAKNEVTGEFLSKREMAPRILDALEVLADGPECIRAIIRLAAEWKNFDLANDEFAARGVVEKAKSLVAGMHAVEELNNERERQGQVASRHAADVERSKEIRDQSRLLLSMFETAVTSTPPQERGYFLQELLNRTFILHDIPVVLPFTRNEGAEQIDGAFRLGGWYYIVECRWRAKLSDIREVDGLLGQVSRSGHQTMGIYLSVNGWSDNVPRLLKQNREKKLLLMEGYDLRSVLCESIGLTQLLDGKLTKLNLESEPFVPAREL